MQGIEGECRQHETVMVRGGGGEWGMALVDLWEKSRVKLYSACVLQNVVSSEMLS